MAVADDRNVRCDTGGIDDKLASDVGSAKTAGCALLPKPTVISRSVSRWTGAGSERSLPGVCVMFRVDASQ